MSKPKQYAERDHMALGAHYIRHVEAMTAEGLHRKSDIAAELAQRDAAIAELSAAIADLLDDAAQCFASIRRIRRARSAVKHAEAICNVTSAADRSAQG